MVDKPASFALEPLMVDESASSASDPLRARLLLRVVVGGLRLHELKLLPREPENIGQPFQVMYICISKILKVIIRDHFLA
jgi:hypothetical protein